ncbi:hypothetical protein RB623_15625 [Mesorhizobium sp. LHD-90]|uniref:hypothetical protein n=1 Tax=Mesorhizobium sp. LHD-90 TaxID=3071414 RepID=UPI0027E16E7D|nr:hypothetical protein [Mesorhizobium sp. LHD-90]MDQ6435487.1 hypothetical protein [Mesorhizobium sp. LHD-90]
MNRPCRRRLPRVFEADRLIGVVAENNVPPQRPSGGWGQSMDAHRLERPPLAGSIDR